MLSAAFLQAIDEFHPTDTLVMEFHSGDRLIIWNRRRLYVSEEWCSYIDDQSVSHFFEPSTVSRVMGWSSLPDLDAPPYPFRNGTGGLR